jgi:hypothetical protein
MSRETLWTIAASQPRPAIREVSKFCLVGADSRPSAAGVWNGKADTRTLDATV